MTPIRFPERNYTYKAPPDWDVRHNGPCHDMPALRDETRNTVESRWVPSAAELALLKKGGAVRLLVHGGMPPVSLEVVQG